MISTIIGIVISILGGTIVFVFGKFFYKHIREYPESKKLSKKENEKFNKMLDEQNEMRSRF